MFFVTLFLSFVNKLWYNANKHFYMIAPYYKGGKADEETVFIDFDLYFSRLLYRT